MNVLDLFSGIGGFSIGLEKAGMRTVAFCETEPFCRAVLAKHWPNVPCYEDVRTLTANRLVRDGISIDVICGGFPCQDISFAGGGKDSQESAAGSGTNFTGLSKKSSRVTRSSKMSQPFALADWTLCLGASLRSGMTRNGIVYPLPTLAPLTDATASGLWPTPRASEWKGVGPIGSRSHKYRLQKGYLDATVQDVEQRTGKLNPRWVEWLMGFPLGHTDLKPSEMPSSRKSQNSLAKQ